MTGFWSSFGELLGLSAEPKDLTLLQVSLRGIIVFVATLAMVRLSSKRSLSEKTAFDAVLIVIVASMLARAINGSAAFFPTLGSGFVLVLLHRLLGFLLHRCALRHASSLERALTGRRPMIVRIARIRARPDAKFLRHDPRPVREPHGPLQPPAPLSTSSTRSSASRR